MGKKGPFGTGEANGYSNSVNTGHCRQVSIFSLQLLSAFLSQSVPLTGAVVVTTPQDIALLDARKGLKMFEKVGVPIIGVVENMSIHICSNCGHAEHIFGEGGGEKLCADYGVPFLGALPLDLKIRSEADSGTPTVVADPDSRIAEIYKDIARKVAVSVSERAKDMTHKFPNIVIQNT